MSTVGLRQKKSTIFFLYNCILFLVKNEVLFKIIITDNKHNLKKLNWNESRK